MTRFTLIYSATVLTLLLFGCNNHDSSKTIEDDRLQLENQFSEIEILAFSAPCVDSTDWSFTTYGAKACGGPQGFLPYYIKTDTALLFALLNSYKTNESAFNKEWGIVSDCSVPNQPSGIKCEEGKAILVYE